MESPQKRRCTAEYSPSVPSLAKARADDASEDLGNTETASDDEVEETFVVLDVPTALATPDALAALSSAAFDLESFGTESPTLELNGQKLVGQFAPFLGSQLVFARDSAAKPWEAVAVANKRIVATAAPDTAATSAVEPGAEDDENTSGSLLHVSGISDSV